MSATNDKKHKSNLSSNTKINDIDSIIEEFSYFGNYQIFNIILICIPMCFNAILTLSYVFTASNLEYRCRIPECDDISGTTNNNYNEPWINFTIPSDDNRKCVRYEPINQITNKSFILNHQNDIITFNMKNNNKNHELCLESKFNKTKKIYCNDVIFKTEEKTIANEWNLICPENEWKLTLVGSVNNIGQFIGIPLGGLISDRYGRRFVLVLGATLSFMIGLIRSFSINYIMFIIFEFMDTLCGSIIFSAAWVLSLELVSIEKRALACTIISIFFSFGEMLLGLVAKLIQDWRLLLRILYGPAIIHITFIWLLPESIKWLMSKGKITETLKILKKASKFNGQEHSFSLLLQNIKNLEKSTTTMITNNDESSSKSNRTDGIFKQLHKAFKSRTIFLRVINCSFCWFTNILVYYGLNLNSVSLAGDKYINFILVCAMEIPGYLICYIFIDKISRRISMCGTLLISGITLALPVITGKGTLIPFLLGKVSITISFTILYVYTTEMFPTNVRHSILSLCSMFGRIGSIIAPQTPLLARYLSSLPLILFSGCAIISGLLSLYFPETLNKSLPKNIEEAECIQKTKNKEEIHHHQQQIVMDSLS